MPNLVQLIQQIAKKVIDESQPTGVVYGTVTKVAPLTITVEQKLPLDIAFLVLTNNVKDHEVDLTVDGVRKTYTVHNALQSGEKVVLIRQQGGQKYIVLDRVVT